MQFGVCICCTPVCRINIKSMCHTSASPQYYQDGFTPATLLLVRFFGWLCVCSTKCLDLVLYIQKIVSATCECLKGENRLNSRDREAIVCWGKVRVIHMGNWRNKMAVAVCVVITFGVRPLFFECVFMLILFYLTWSQMKDLEPRWDLWNPGTVTALSFQSDPSTAHQVFIL